MENIELIILNPVFMLGGLNPESSSGKLLGMLKRNRIVFAPPGGKSFVYVLDVAQAVINSFKILGEGQKYLLCSECLSFRQFYLKYSRIAHKKLIIIDIPHFLMRLVSIVTNLLEKVGVRFSLSGVNVDILCENPCYSSRLAKRDLKLNFTPIDAVLMKYVDV
ncbi:MAG: hypothetical protein IT245_01825 [Bacteroidia bacterium]|nr:hypothetical protein [Bacteroidia bacterium]